MYSIPERRIDLFPIGKLTQRMTFQLISTSVIYHFRMCIRTRKVHPFFNAIEQYAIL